MSRKILIQSWQEPFHFHKGIAVAFDIFRCSTTIHTLYSLGNEVFLSRSLEEVKKEKAALESRVFSELSQKIPCLERYDNSPHLAISLGKSAVPSLVATTSGTPSMFQAANFEQVVIGSLTNFSTLVQYLNQWEGSITLIPSALQGSGHIEDETVAQAVAVALEGFTENQEFVRKCAEQAREKIIESGRPAFLTQKLPTGKEDTDIALTIDKFSQNLKIDFTSKTMAKVGEV